MVQSLRAQQSVVDKLRAEAAKSVSAGDKPKEGGAPSKGREQRPCKDFTANGYCSWGMRAGTIIQKARPSGNVRGVVSREQDRKVGPKDLRKERAARVTETERRETGKVARKQAPVSIELLILDQGSFSMGRTRELSVTQSVKGASLSALTGIRRTVRVCAMSVERTRMVEQASVLPRRGMDTRGMTRGLISSPRVMQRS